MDPTLLQKPAAYALRTLREQEAMGKNKETKPPSTKACHSVLKKCQIEVNASTALGTEELRQTSSCRNILRIEGNKRRINQDCAKWGLGLGWRRRWVKEFFLKDRKSRWESVREDKIQQRQGQLSSCHGICVAI